MKFFAAWNVMKVKHPANTKWRLRCNKCECVIERNQITRAVVVRVRWIFFSRFVFFCARCLIFTVNRLCRSLISISCFVWFWFCFDEILLIIRIMNSFESTVLRIFANVCNSIHNDLYEVRTTNIIFRTFLLFLVDGRIHNYCYGSLYICISLFQFYNCKCHLIFNLRPYNFWGLFFCLFIWLRFIW